METLGWSLMQIVQTESIAANLRFHPTCKALVKDQHYHMHAESRLLWGPSKLRFRDRICSNLAQCSTVFTVISNICCSTANRDLDNQRRSLALQAIRRQCSYPGPPIFLRDTQLGHTAICALRGNLFVRENLPLPKEVQSLSRREARLPGEEPQAEPARRQRLYVVVH